MKKFKGWIKTHWFATLVISISAILTLLSAYYAWDFAKDAKKISDKRAIYQLGVTAIAASVGIGTILNSTRSASIAAESMRVTKDKEKREQASHLIPLSKIDYFPLNAPFYIKKFNYLVYNFSKSTRENIHPAATTNGVNDRHMFDVERKSYIETITNNRFMQDDSDFPISLVNVGKGSCVNLEYSFEFSNLEEFSKYSIKPDVSLLHPGISEQMKPLIYSMIISDNFELKFKDLYLDRFIDGEYTEWREEGQGTDFNYQMKKHHVIEYENIVKPNQQINIQLPDEFLMLCKHYVNMTYLYDRLEKDQLVQGAENEYFEEWGKDKYIKPFGLLNISFFEESLIRTGEMNPDMKTELTYSVTLKDIQVKTRHQDIRYYLEINLSKSETKKKRAYS